ncbi:MAG: ATP-binding protein, partial [Pseudobdellovibrionaceae bacterium]|nr:ATP-binding protein [Pseudobdellovibrionaceae bacterium]
AWQAIAAAEALLTPDYKRHTQELLETKHKIAARAEDYKTAYAVLQSYHSEWKLSKEKEEAKGLERLSATLSLKVEEERTKTLRQENAAQLRTAKLLLALGALLIVLTAVAIRSTVVARRRNRQLVASQARIKQIMSTIDEGLLIINQDGRIGSDYSAHLEQIFDPSLPFAQQDFVTRIPGQSCIAEEELSMIREILHAVLGEDRLAWDLNSANLPREMLLGDAERTIELRWIPIFSADEKLNGLLVSCTDVTQERILTRTLGAQQKYIQTLPDVLRELLRVQPEHTGRLLEKAEALLTQMESGTLPKGPLQRDLHTYKGEARSLGFRSLSHELHDLESLFQGDASPHIKDPGFRDQLKQVREQIDEYRSFTEILYKETQGEGQFLPWLGTMLNQQISTARHHLLGAGLEMGEILLSDAYLGWTTEQMEVLQVFAIHAVNNSIDHGFIIPQSKGERTDRPTLEIAARVESGQLLIEISDNGAGLKLDELGRIAQARGFTPRADETVADLVFYDGISTTEKVTQSSGRGMGLAAVKADIERLGGRVGISNRPDRKGTRIWAALPLQTSQLNAV